MDTKRLTKFLIITFVITGIAWSGLAVLTSLNIIPFSHPLGTILHIIGGFGPTIATFFVLEEKLNFPIATIITGVVWGIWHIPLWFVNGSSQQNMPFLFFLALAVILSFWLATIYKKTKCVFACSVFHGLTNTLLSVFIIKVNVLLVIGLIAMLVYSIYLWYCGEAKQ